MDQSSEYHQRAAAISFAASSNFKNTAGFSGNKNISNLQGEFANVSPLTLQLTKWRREYTIQMAKSQNRARQVNTNDTQDWTVGILCSGGCLDTITAIRTGFRVIWGSEINVEQTKMFEDLTGAKCLGDTFGSAVASAESVKYLKSGQPCVNYARSGNGKGEEGDTGWMFVKQAEVILKVSPWCFCIEISDNATNVNGGSEVKKLKAMLGVKYVIRTALLELWRYGDPSNRKRLFMIGFKLELGQAAYEFEWPGYIL